MNVAAAIIAQGQSDAQAVICDDAVLTYGELRREVQRLATVLLSRNYAKGDRVGIFAENSPFFVVGYLAIILAGLVAVPFQTEVDESLFEMMVLDAGIQEILVSKHLSRRLLPWAKAAAVPTISEMELTDLPQEAGGAFPAVEPARDLAALMFTSGSTGTPKGVMVSHRNIHCNTRDIISYVELGPQDRGLVVLPFHYCFGISLLHTLLMAGGTLVINNDFRLYPEVAIRALEHNRCTGMAGVPSTYQILLRKSRFRQTAIPHLRWLQQAGGKLPNPFIREIHSSFPNVRFFLMYGQTEATARLSYLPPERLVDKLGSIGKGLPSTRLEVLSSDGTQVRPGSGETGEIVATGDNIGLGYWNDAEETARYFRNGRLHTGDIAQLDLDGFIFIVEREREIIKSGGNRISAKEVEDVIAELPETIETAVIGVPHELLGESVKVFVVARSGAGLTAEVVKAHCRKRLPAFKVPGDVVFLDALPHNSSGKISKQLLKAGPVEVLRATTAPRGV